VSDLNQHPLIRQYIAWNAFGRMLGMAFEIPEPGSVVYTMTITPEMLATPVAAHGGSVAALMDATLGVACLSQVCEEGRIVSTVSLTIQYQSPALLGDVLTAKGRVTKAGKRLLFVEGTIVNQKGETIASALATMNAYPAEKVASR
jgi:uncharacterized protein (TIGR00369 family)